MPSPRRLKQAEPARAPALKQQAARPAERAPAFARPRPSALADLQAATPGQVLRLQRQVGNRALNRALAPRPAQSQLSAKAASAPLPTPEALVEQLAQPLQRQAARPVGLAGGEAGGAVEAQLAARRGAGAPLPTATRAAMEGGIGADFSSVRIHTGPESQMLNRQLGAQAFTYGADIYMGAGKYAPGTSAGRRLLAHELTHVVQQGGAHPAPAAGQTAQRSGAERPGPAAALGAAAAPTAIQRDLMTNRELMDAIGGERADPAVLETAGFDQLLAGLATFQRLVIKAQQLNSYRDKEKFWAAASALFAEAAGCVRGLMANVNLVEEAIAVPGILEALPVLDTLRRQLEDEAMIQIIDLALAAERKFSLVQTVEEKHAKRVGEHHTDLDRGGRLRVLREKLGGGAINAVSLLEDIRTGTAFVFKADKTEGMVALDEVGAQIAEGARGFADRAVASYRLDQLLGFGVMPETHYASKDGYFGHIMKMAAGASPQQAVNLTPEQAVRANDPNQQAPLQKIRNKEENVDGYYTSLLDTGPMGGRDVVVETRKAIGAKVLRANGERFVIQHAYFNFDYSRAEIQEGLTSLQLIDLISGQLDRHPGNYFIGVDPASGRIRVTAIDNDAAFGTAHEDLTQTIQAGHLPSLPQVVSKAQWQRIKHITDADIREALRGTIRPDEVEATVKRFHQLKEHLQGLARQGLLVDRFDRSTFVRLVEADAPAAGGGQPRRAASYVGRDANLLREKAKLSQSNLVLDARRNERTEGVPTAEPSFEQHYRRLPPTPRQWQRGRLAYEPK